MTVGMEKPRGFDQWNRALQGAYRKGYAAGVADARAACPYEDMRKHDGRLTWSRSFITAWFDGFEAGKKQVND